MKISLTLWTSGLGVILMISKNNRKVLKRRRKRKRQNVRHHLWTTCCLGKVQLSSFNNLRSNRSLLRLSETIQVYWLILMKCLGILWRVKKRKRGNILYPKCPKRETNRWTRWQIILVKINQTHRLFWRILKTKSWQIKKLYNFLTLIRNQLKLKMRRWKLYYVTILQMSIQF